MFSSLISFIAHIGEHLESLHAGSWERVLIRNYQTYLLRLAHYLSAKASTSERNSYRTRCLEVARSIYALLLPWIKDKSLLSRVDPAVWYNAGAVCCMLSLEVEDVVAEGLSREMFAYWSYYCSLATVSRDSKSTLLSILQSRTNPYTEVTYSCASNGWPESLRESIYCADQN